MPHLKWQQSARWDEAGKWLVRAERSTHHVEYIEWVSHYRLLVVMRDSVTVTMNLVIWLDINCPLVRCYCYLYITGAANSHMDSFLAMSSWHMLYLIWSLSRPFFLPLFATIFSKGHSNHTHAQWFCTQHCATWVQCMSTTYKSVLWTDHPLGGHNSIVQ